ncbi:cell adhesion molecule DSCAM-like isoform X3 [Ostrea edulis]|uniref:cell adhesion molecule DSCAM-like isoform X3 n=1 Tax=Ostrea edulis TaxID=37623 RepID=UPI0024AFE10F|nr:cell adhesion molecule DSCAM-like isoform X3 [Ostrea edulis]
MCAGMLSPSFGYGTLSLMCLILPHCFGQITLYPNPATVIQGQTLKLTCQSAESGGNYQFYSLDTSMEKMNYGTAIGSFKNCNLGQHPNFIIECDFDNWIFNLTVSQPVHNQVIYCSRQRPSSSILSVRNTTIRVQGQDITLTPQNPAIVRKGQTLVLTCQSNQTSGLYTFFYINSEGNTILYAAVGGGFKSCSNNTNDAFTECDFGTPWKFKLTLLNPVHDQVVYCRRSGGGQDLKNSSTTIFVQVPVSSVTLSPSSSVEVFEGTSFTFRCVSKAARPPANITWYKDSVVVIGSSSISSTNNLLYDVTSNLTSSFQRTDNGKRIFCTAVNINGETPIQSARTELSVIYAPPVAPQLTADGFTSVDEGQSITLRCTLSTLGNPHITWNWVCGNDTLTTGVTNTGTQSVLTLTANRKYNQRTCQCRATSPRSSLSYNRTSATQINTVYYNNVITSNLDKEYVTSEHERLQIKCDVEGNPLSTITWLFVENDTVVKSDSNVDSSTLDISSANCLDYGSYKVTAENGKGPAAVRTTNVVVRCKPRLHYSASQTPNNLVIGSCDSLQILVRLLLYPPATLTQWTFIGKHNVSRVLHNNTDGYRITVAGEENEQNITLHKNRVYAEDFGNYTLMVQNDVGTFYGSHQVDTATPPLIPTNVTLDCGNPFSIKLSWISNFNGGDSQTFKISYSTVGNLSASFKDVEYIRDNGYGRLHSYTPSIELQGTVWFTVTAFNVLGKSTSDVLCTVTELERKNIDKGINITDLTKAESSTPMPEHSVHLHGERGVYEELTETENGNQYESLSTKDEQDSERQTYESIQGSSGESKYEKLSTVSKREDDDDKYQNSQKLKTSSPSDVNLKVSKEV